MSKNIIKDITNKVPYLYYENMEKFTLHSGIVLGCTSMTIANEALGITALSLLGAYIASKLSSNIYNTTDAKKLKELYETMVKNIVVLANEFGLENPYEIFSLHTKLVNEGYLSHNHKYNYSLNNVVDCTNFSGSTIFAGRGVCRHNTTLLTDVLKNSGITAHNLSVIENSTVDQCSHVAGDHLITLAVYDNLKYILDPTNMAIYENINNLLFTKHSHIYISKQPYTLYNSNDTKKNINKALDYTQSDVIVGNILFKQTNKMLSNNLDVLESFYKQNVDLYDETTDIIIKTRIKKVTLFK